MIPFAATLQRRVQRRCFWMARTTSENYVGPARVFIRNGMSIGLAVFSTAHRRMSHYFTTFSPKIAPSTWGIGSPSNTWYLWPTRVINPTGIRSLQPFSYGFQMLCCTMHYQWRRKTPKIDPSPWDFVTLPEEDRATTIDNMHKNLVKIARFVR